MAKIENRIDFEEWLKAQPRKVVEVMALRIALRLIPLFLGNYPIGTVREVKPLPGLLPIFRSLAVGFTAATYPDSNPIIRLVGSLAVADLKRWNESLLGMLSTLRSESNAGLPNVAEYPLNVGYATDASVHCLLYTDQNALSHVRAAASSACGNADRISTFGELSIWAAISEDAIAIENGLTAQKLVASKLWPQKIWPANLPNEFSRLWFNLRIDLGDVGQDWGVWTDWYEARLAGKKPRWKDVEIFRVTLSDEAATTTAKDGRGKDWDAILKPHEADWEKGPAHVNALIKARIKGGSTKRLIAQARGLENTHLGARIVQEGQTLRIDTRGEKTDFDAAADPNVVQFQDRIVRLAREFASAAQRLDNQHGWDGIEGARKRLITQLNCSTAEIPSRLVGVYGAVLDIASFLEQDNKTKPGDHSGIDNLDTDTRRKLSAIVVAAAPWVRMFPTARSWDEETGAFLTRPELFKPSLQPASHIVGASNSRGLISSDDAAILRVWIEAAKRGEFQSDKARVRSVFTVKNIVVKALTTLTTLFAGGVINDLSPNSTLMMNAAHMLKDCGDSIAKLIENEPAHVKNAIFELMKLVQDFDFSQLPPF